MSFSEPQTNNMAVTFLDVHRNSSQGTNHNPTSNFDLSKYHSAAPTLNNTPSASRQSSPSRNKVKERIPTPSPTRGDIEAMDSRFSKEASRLSNYSSQELDIAYMGNIIIACFFTSGLIDAVSFNSWNCFVGMQTGKPSYLTHRTIN